MGKDHLKYVIQTRQKADRLFFTTTALGATATFESAVKRVLGYGSINFLGISDHAFTLRVEEAINPDGPWTQTSTVASTLDATTGHNFICEQVSPCGVFMRVFIDAGATPLGSLSFLGVGLPVAGGGGSSGGGGGPSSIVQLKDGSASPTLASVKVDGTLIGTQGSVLVGGETPTGTQKAIQLNAAGEVIVAGPVNKPTFAVDHITVPVPGTAAQGQAQVVPDGFSIFLRALTTNTGKIWIGPDAATAQDHTKAQPLDRGDFLEMYLTNVDEIFIDADVADEGAAWAVEKS